MSTSTDVSDAFAHLSADIILDVLEIGCPKFEDLAGLDLTDGRWGDIVRSGRFTRRTLDVLGDGDKYRKEFYSYGLKYISIPVEYEKFSANSNDLVFTYVGLHIGQISTELENRILCRATQSVVINAMRKEERIPEILEILATRPISHLSTYTSCANSGVDLGTSLPKLLDNPHLRRFDAYGAMFENLDLLDTYVNFVQKPNFVYLGLNWLTEIPRRMMPIVLEYWKKLTVFPSHMQGIHFEHKNVDRNRFNFGFKEVGRVNKSLIRRVYYLDHPNDSSRRIECYVYQNDEAQLCLTSKEDTVYAEFADYEFSQLRKHIHKCGSFDSKCW